MTPTVTLLQGNCLDVLRTLPAASVHCVVTSPLVHRLVRFLSTVKGCADNAVLVQFAHLFAQAFAPLNEFGGATLAATLPGILCKSLNKQSRKARRGVVFH